MHEAVIVEALRSPIGKFQGALSGLPASHMGQTAENVAEQFSISYEEHDALAVEAM